MAVGHAACTVSCRRWPLVFVDEPAEDERRLIGSWGRAGDGVVGLRRPELAAALGAFRCSGPRAQQDRVQVAVTEDQHLVATLVRAMSASRSA